MFYSALMEACNCKYTTIFTCFLSPVLYKNVDLRISSYVGAIVRLYHRIFRSVGSSLTSLPSALHLHTVSRPIRKVAVVREGNRLPHTADHTLCVVNFMVAL